MTQGNPPSNPDSVAAHRQRLVRYWQLAKKAAKKWLHPPAAQPVASAKGSTGGWLLRLFGLGFGLGAVLIGASVLFPAIFTASPPVVQALPEPPPQAPAAAWRVREDVPVAPPSGPQLVIVIDDIGYNLRRLRDFMALEIPLTYAILPHLPYSQASAQLVAQAGGDVLIHLPMQPLSYPRQNPGPQALLLDLPSGELEARMSTYLEELPQAIGASNHMGSAFTADHMALERVLATLQQRQLFFLNSLTEPSGVPRQLAQMLGMPYLERHLFLDNTQEVEAIQRQVAKALALAQRRGSVIALGHPYRQTLQALEGLADQAAEAGVALVSISALLLPPAAEPEPSLSRLESKDLNHGDR